MKVEWGTGQPSSLEAAPDGQCVAFTFNNTLTDTVDYMPLQTEAGTAYVNFHFYSEADSFFVLPEAGWEIIGEATLKVEEWSSAVILVCQMLLG
jgi:hypothetical protein